MPAGGCCARAPAPRRETCGRLLLEHTKRTLGEGGREEGIEKDTFRQEMENKVIWKASSSMGELTELNTLQAGNAAIQAKLRPLILSLAATCPRATRRGATRAPPRT